MIPSILDLNIIDSYIYVSYDEAMAVGKYLLKEEGLFLGLSSITNIAGAIKLQQSLNKKQFIVTISPDAGDSYIENYKEYYYE
jgi:cysteine synthase